MATTSELLLVGEMRGDSSPSCIATEGLSVNLLATRNEGGLTRVQLLQCLPLPRSELQRWRRGSGRRGRRRYRRQGGGIRPTGTASTVATVL